LEKNPVFDTDPAAAAAANPGEDVAPFFEQGNPSRVNKAGAAGKQRGAPAPPPFMAALRAGAGAGSGAAAVAPSGPAGGAKGGPKRPSPEVVAAAAAECGKGGDAWAPLLSMLRRMSPNEIDREMRAMQVGGAHSSCRALVIRGVG
jgi:hypothetical protein